MNMDTKLRLVEIFNDTEKFYTENKTLAAAIKSSRERMKFYSADDCPALPEKRFEKTEISVTKDRSFAAAMRLSEEYPDARIAVHNFASATNPGGGVRRGSRAQEECLCRCSTLLPLLETSWLRGMYYDFHLSRHDTRYTDACIYTPDVKIIKTDTDFPERLPESGWKTVDIITCAAPNLRENPYNAMNPGSGKAVKVTDKEQLEIHIGRSRHMLSAAAANGADILVMGAFGCGAFRNDPEIVAKAYKTVLPEFDGIFKVIEFAVYCTEHESGNYDAFRKILSNR